LEATLRSHPVFRYVDDEQWDVFMRYVVREIYPKDSYFLQAGEVAEKIGFVQSGLFRGFYRNNKGVIFTKEFILERQILGCLSSIYRSVASDYTYQAIEESEVWTFDYVVLSTLALDHPVWERVKRLIAEEAFLRSEEKQHNLQILSTKENLEFFAKNSEILKKRIPQFMIASYFGVNPVTLSRIANQDEIKKKNKG